MKDNSIFIKEKRKDLFTRGFIILALMIVSLLCAFAPLLMDGINDGRTAFYAIGGILFVTFLSMFIYLLYKEFHPDTLMILGSRGFVDKKNVGENIEIEWTNVASVKLLGNTEMPYLGITLENSDIVMAKMKKREAEEMRDNIDEGLPHILIAQNEVYTPISDIKDTFTRFVRDARALNNDTPTQKTKQNPFTSDDVLRAFGKLPPKDNDTVEKIPDNTDQSATVDVSSQSKTANTDSYSSDVDTYIYELSKEKESPKAPPAPPANDAYEEQDVTKNNDSDSKILFTYSPENEDASFDALSAEINEFFARAKSSKITELGKILNETDVPYSISKEQKNIISSSDSIPKEPMPKEETSEIIDRIVSDRETDYIEPTVQTETTKNIEDINYNNDFRIIFPEDLFDENEQAIDESDVTFEKLIQQSKELDEIAFNAAPNTNDNHEQSDSDDESMGDTKIF